MVGPLVGGPIGVTLYDVLIRATPAYAEQAVVHETRMQA
jgi:hypothetical protein